MAAIFFDPFTQLLDSAGDPIPGATLETTRASDGLPLATFSDNSLTIVNPNPASGATTGNQVTNSSGFFGAIYLQNAVYTMVFKDGNGVVLRTIANYDPATGGGGGAALTGGVGITVTGANAIDIDTSVTADLTTAQTFLNKTVSMVTNNLLGTVAQFNTALTGDSFSTLAGNDTHTGNKVFSGDVDLDGDIATQGKSIVVQSAGAGVDSLAAIHAARDAVGVDGTIILAAGVTYEVSNRIIMNVTGQTLVIDGIIRLRTGAGGAANASASGITFKGSGTIDSGGIGDGIGFISGAFGARVLGSLSFHNPLGRAIQALAGCYSSTATIEVRNVNVTFDAVGIAAIGTTNLVLPISMENITSATTERVVIDNCQVDFSNWTVAEISNTILAPLAISVGNTNGTSGDVRNVVCTNNRCFWPEVSDSSEWLGLDLVGRRPTSVEIKANNGRCYEVLMTDNLIIGGDLGLSVGQANSVLIANNVVRGQTSYNIECVSGDNCIIRDNYLDGSNAHHPVSAGNMTQVSVNGNFILGPRPTDGLTDASAIWLTGTIDADCRNNIITTTHPNTPSLKIQGGNNFDISGCTFNNTGVTSNAVEISGTVGTVKIIGCTFKGATSNSIRIAGAILTTLVTIGNIGDNTGPYLDSGTVTTHVDAYNSGIVGLTGTPSGALVVGTDVQAWDADLDNYAANPLTIAELTQVGNINTTLLTAADWTDLKAYADNNLTVGQLGQLGNMGATTFTLAHWQNLSNYSQNSLTNAELTQLRNIDTTLLTVTNWANLAVYGGTALTAAELTQLANIGTNTFTNSQWGNLATFASFPLSSVELQQLQNINANVFAIADWTALKTYATGALTAAELTQLANIDTSTFTTAQWGNLATYASNTLNAAELAQLQNIDLVTLTTLNWQDLEIYADAALTNAELAQLQNIDTTTFSGAQWVDLNIYATTPLDTAELTQLGNIGTTTFTAAQWAFLNTVDQNISSSDAVTFGNITCWNSTPQMIWRPTNDGQSARMHFYNTANAFRGGINYLYSTDEMQFSSATLNKFFLRSTGLDMSANNAILMDGNEIIDSDRIHIHRSYTALTLPAVKTSGSIYVSDEVGGPTLAASDGVNWLRVSDNAIVS